MFILNSSLIKIAIEYKILKNKIIKICLFVCVGGGGGVLSVKGVKIITCLSSNNGTYFVFFLFNLIYYSR